MSVAHAALVFVGAGLGGVSRYAFGRLLSQPVFLPFELSTLAVNLLGAMCAALLFSCMGAEWVKGHPMGLLLMTGFLGGLTTFSAFTVEGVSLLQSNPMMALLHAAVHVFGCILVFFWVTKLVRFFLPLNAVH